MKNLVEVKNLKKNYGLKNAVKDISFEIKENEILGLLGPNGCGKTTTIGMMLGLLKPTSGEILIDGKKIEESRIEILKKINFISPYIELPKKLTVRQNLIVYGKLYNVENLNQRLEYLIEKLRLSDLLNRITGELSSGQKNRIGLTVKDWTPQQKKQIKENAGVLVLDVADASLNAGIRKGDVILGLNNNPVSSVQSFNQDLKKVKKGKTIALLIYRNGDTLYVPIKITN